MKYDWIRVVPGAILVAMIVLIVFIEPNFLVGGGVRIMLVQALPLLFLACGQMLVMLLGGIDLSNAALGVLGAVLVALMLDSTGLIAIPVTLAIVTLLGGVVGWISGTFQVPTFAVTLGAMGVWQALALMFSGQSTVSVDDNLPLISWMLDMRILGLEMAIWLGLGCVLVVWFVTSRTSVGLRLKATGLNEKAAILAGVSGKKARTLVYASSGFFAGLAGLTLTAQQGTATATGAGIGLLLPSIAATIIGGCAVAGGLARPFNVAIGACIVTLVPIGATAVGLDPRVQYLVFGLIIVLAVILSTDRRKAKTVY